MLLCKNNEKNKIENDENKRLEDKRLSFCELWIVVFCRSHSHAYVQCSSYDTNVQNN